MKVFMTFGSKPYEPAVRRICQEATAFPFDEICGYTEKDLKQDPLFWEKHGTFVSQNPRGYGFWIWKPYLILKKLQSLQEGDILVYADAGCELNPKGLKRFQDYLDVLDVSEQGILSFQMKNLERDYTKKAILNYFQDDGSTGQCVGGIQILKKCPHTLHLLQEWVDHMRYEWINDTPDSQAIPRNDQSIYSVLVKKYGSIRLPDETYFEDWSKGIHIPILAKRKRF